MFLKSVGVVEKKGMECEDMVDLIKIYLFLGETEVNFSCFVNIQYWSDKSVGQL